MPRVAAIAVLLLAGGCATLPPPEATDDWPARRTGLQELDRWTLNGRIAVAAGEDGFTGGFEWAQRGGVADIELSSPMGGTAMQIHIDGDRLVVSSSRGTLADEDAERFIADRVGAGRPLPVGAMRYWLVGTPAPGAPHEETLGADRRLESLSQSGWQVRYVRYDAVGSLALPARMELTTDGLRLRVAVAGWRLSP